MRRNITLSGNPVMLAITLEGLQDANLKFMAEDPSKKNTAYQMRLIELKKGQQKIYVRLPLSPKQLSIVLWEAQNPKTKDVILPYVRITNIEKMALPQKIDQPILRDKNVKEFLRFAEEFSLKAGFISAVDSVYKSDNGKFTIIYFDEIKGANGNAINTPARINQNNGTIEISASKFRKYSIPMRMAILLHEFSHYWLNKDMANETEADLNALQIYLGLGYPRLDAINVFLNVFMGSPTESNRDRWESLKAFIQEFEQNTIVRKDGASMKLLKNKLLKREKPYVNFVNE